VILVSTDGLGWQFPERFNTPNLDFMAQTGVKAKYMKVVTPSVTWPNHQTYMTGLYPESHGIVSNRFWDPAYKEKFIFDHDCSNGDPKFWNESEPIWLTLQKMGKDSGLHFWPGFFKWPPYEHCYPNYTIPFSKRIEKIMSWLTSKKPPQFVGFYADQPDWVGHSYGPDSDKFRRMVEHVDKVVVGGMIDSLRNAGLLEKVNLIFVSDHSFTTVNKSRVIFFDDFIDPATYMLTEATAFGHIWPKPGKFDEIYTNLTTHMIQKYPQVKVYKKEEIPEAFHYKNNRRVPPIYVSAGFGYGFKPRRAWFNVSDDWVYGYHGYPSDERMGAIFYARGPAFKTGYYFDGPLRSVDIYPMMCELLGIQPHPNNGSLSNMMQLMV
ncbi:predicted protein, partial [Nematostella vectensis]